MLTLGSNIVGSSLIEWAASFPAGKPFWRGSAGEALTKLSAVVGAEGRLRPTGQVARSDSPISSARSRRSWRSAGSAS
jgi:hypothetical protein